MRRDGGGGGGDTRSYNGDAGRLLPKGVLFQALGTSNGAFTAVKRDEKAYLFCPKGYTDMFRDNQVPRTSVVK